MNQRELFKTSLDQLSQQQQCEIESKRHEHTLTVKPEKLLIVLTALRDEDAFRFDQLMDVTAVDYLEYGKTEWKTEQASGSGFSRGVSQKTFGRFTFDNNPICNEMPTPRFAVVYHLLSVEKNQRLRVKVFCTDNEMPRVASVCELWTSANWYEREVFDLFGIVFDGHPDLRRLLTDYGFVGHPLRKDFPLVGHVEVRYDPSKKRVIYEPVSIEPRVLVPKVIRENHRDHEQTRTDGKEP